MDCNDDVCFWFICLHVLGLVAVDVHNSSLKSLRTFSLVLRSSTLSYSRPMWMIGECEYAISVL